MLFYNFNNKFKLILILSIKDGEEGKLKLNLLNKENIVKNQYLILK